MRRSVVLFLLTAIVAALAGLAASCGGGSVVGTDTGGQAAPSDGGEMTQECVDALRAFNDYQDSFTAWSNTVSDLHNAWGDVYGAALAGTTEAELTVLVVAFEKAAAAVDPARKEAGAALETATTAIASCNVEEIPAPCQKAFDAMGKVLAADAKQTELMKKTVKNIKQFLVALESGDDAKRDALGDQAEALTQQYNKAVAKTDAAMKRYGNQIERCNAAY